MADLLYLMGFINEATPNVGSTEYNPDNFHVTIMPEHAIPDRNMDQYLKELDNITKWFKPVLFTIGETKTFRNSFGFDVPVVTLNTINGNNLHNSVLAAVESLDGRPTGANFTGKEYSPHVSFWDDPKPFEINSLSLIHHKDGFGKNVVNLRNFKLNF